MLLTTRQAAEYLNLKAKTLSHWRWAGCGPRYVKLGGNVRYRQEDLDAYIAESARTSTTESPKRRQVLTDID